MNSILYLCLTFCLLVSGICIVNISADENIQPEKKEISEAEIAILSLPPPPGGASPEQDAQETKSKGIQSNPVRQDTAEQFPRVQRVAPDGLTSGVEYVDEENRGNRNGVSLPAGIQVGARFSGQTAPNRAANKQNAAKVEKKTGGKDDSQQAIFLDVRALQRQVQSPRPPAGRRRVPLIYVDNSSSLVSFNDFTTPRPPQRLSTTTSRPTQPRPISRFVLPGPPQPQPQSQSPGNRRQNTQGRVAQQQSARNQESSTSRSQPSSSRSSPPPSRTQQNQRNDFRNSFPSVSTTQRPQRAPVQPELRFFGEPRLYSAVDDAAPPSPTPRQQSVNFNNQFGQDKPQSRQFQVAPTPQQPPRQQSFDFDFDVQFRSEKPQSRQFQVAPLQQQRQSTQARFQSPTPTPRRQTTPPTILRTSASTPQTSKRPVPKNRLTSGRVPGNPSIPGNFGFLSGGQTFGPQNIPGRAGADYPVYNEVPFTNFDCQDYEHPGFYADVEAGCQVYHNCDVQKRKHTFMCSNGTIFSQEFMICDWWYNVKCDEASSFYNLNAHLYTEPPEKPEKKADSNSRSKNK